MRAQAIIVAGLLRDLAERVESGDSFEGSVSWTCMLDELGPDEYDLVACFRTGNRDGQGGTSIIDSIMKDKSGETHEDG